ncbi:DUF6350 family protein [Streptomyces sp. Da 82-17]|uniref:cell division protein PerM n=1 Tax=Streptomyces sp. Da 82-17 TaxID=3377116 RepID=UPI0038D46D7A
MTHTTDRSSSPRPPAGSQASAAPPSVLGGLARSGRRRRASAVVGSVVGGVVAAGLGLGALAVLVMAGWISSPYPDSGPDDALHVTAALWLLAHGADLVRSDTLTGSPAPLGVTPLLLVVVPALLLHRAGRDAAEAADAAERPRLAFGGVVAGYLAVGALATWFAADGPLRADSLSAVLHLVALAVLGTAAGVWAAYGRPHGPLPAPLRRLLDALDPEPDGQTSGKPGKGPDAEPGAKPDRLAVRSRAGAALRAGAAGVLVLVGGGALLVGVSLVLHTQAAQTSYLQLSDVWSGRGAVLLVAVALVPNAAVWGASYGLGPGFALGAGGAAWPAAASTEVLLPPFPLLAAVPDAGAGTPLTWSACAVGGACGLTVGWFTARAAVPKGEPEAAWSRGATALTAGLAALVCGLALAALAALAGGPLGDGALADFGPVWWRTGGAALLWAGLLGAPVALGLRAWRVRTRRAGRAGDAWTRLGGRFRLPSFGLSRLRAKLPALNIPAPRLPSVRLPGIRLPRVRLRRRRKRADGADEEGAGFEPYDFTATLVGRRAGKGNGKEG